MARVTCRMGRGPWCVVRVVCWVLGVVHCAVCCIAAKCTVQCAALQLAALRVFHRECSVTCDAWRLASGVCRVSRGRGKWRARYIGLRCVGCVGRGALLAGTTYPTSKLSFKPQLEAWSVGPCGTVGQCTTYSTSQLCKIPHKDQLHWRCLWLIRASW